MKDFIKQINAWLVAHPVVRKPLNTLWQAFLGVFLLGLSPVIDAVVNHGVDAGKTALFALLSAALAAAFSAVKTYIVELLKESK